MNQSFEKCNLKGLIYDEITIDEIFTTAETWFNSLSQELKKKHDDIERILRRIKQDETFDYSSIQSLISFIVELQQTFESTSLPLIASS